MPFVQHRMTSVQPGRAHKHANTSFDATQLQAVKRTFAFLLSNLKVGGMAYYDALCDSPIDGWGYAVCTEMGTGFKWEGDQVRTKAVFYRALINSLLEMAGAAYTCQPLGAKLNTLLQLQEWPTASPFS